MAKSALPKNLQEFKLLRITVIAALVIYIVGIIPNYNKGITSLFGHPIVRLILIILIICISWVDTTIGILVAVAYISSIMMASNSTYQTPLQVLETKMQEIPLPQFLKPNKETTDKPVSESYDEDNSQNSNTAPNGCNPIVGYNAAYDTMCQQDKNKCLYTSVATWDNELNAQGMNDVMGFAGNTDGSTF